MPKDEQKDQHIIQAIEAGNDSPVFEILYQRTFGKVRGLIFKSGGSQEEAEDIFQDAVLSFYRQVKLGRYEHRTEIDGFIYAVSRNLWINRVKIKNRSSALDDNYEAASDENLEQSLFDKERQQKLQDALNKLGDRCRELLINTTYKGHSMKEIVEIMGFKNENAAKTRHYKCKQRLGEIVRKSPSLMELYRG